MLIPQRVIPPSFLFYPVLLLKLKELLFVLFFSFCFISHCFVVLFRQTEKFSYISLSVTVTWLLGQLLSFRLPTNISFCFVGLHCAPEGKGYYEVNSRMTYNVRWLLRWYIHYLLNIIFNENLHCHPKCRNFSIYFIFIKIISN